MKLARVEHIRCQEFAAFTYVWVRDDMTEDEFHERVYAAEKDYLNSLREFKEAEKPYLAYASLTQPNWEKHRDRNVGEVLDEYAATKTKRALFQEKRRAALKGFDAYLADQEGVESFWEGKPALDSEVDWGHMHGYQIDYGETKWPKFKLLKPTKKVVPDGIVRHVVDDEEWL